MIWLFLSVGLLAACTTPEEQAAARMQQEQQDRATCRSYGLKPKSEAHGMCLLQLDLAREQQSYNNSRYHYGMHYGHFGPRIGTGIGYYFPH